MNIPNFPSHTSHRFAVTAFVCLATLFGPVVADFQTAQAGITQKLLRLHNKERQKRNLPRLKRNSALTRSARKYAGVMARNNHFSHTGPAPSFSTFDRRIQSAGFRRFPVGENIARGPGSITALVRAWMRSPGHRRNILNRRYQYVGFGKASGANGPYWVTDFGG